MERAEVEGYLVAECERDQGGREGGGIACGFLVLSGEMPE